MEKKRKEKQRDIGGEKAKSKPKDFWSVFGGGSKDEKSNSNDDKNTSSSSSQTPPPPPPPGDPKPPSQLAILRAVAGVTLILWAFYDFKRRAAPAPGSPSASNQLTTPHAVLSLLLPTGKVQKIVKKIKIKIKIFLFHYY